MSCLFQSLGKLLRIPHETLRKDVCDYLQSNPVFVDDGTRAHEVIEWDSSGTPSSYVESMRSTSTWGGAVEIRAVCDMTGRVVHVQNLCSGNNTSKKVIDFYPLRAHPNRKCLTVSWNGCHYEAVDVGNCPGH